MTPRLMEVRQKDYLLMLVLFVTQTKINCCLLWPRSLATILILKSLE